MDVPEAVVGLRESFFLQTGSPPVRIIKGRVQFFDQVNNFILLIQSSKQTSVDEVAISFPQSPQVQIRGQPSAALSRSE